MQVFLDIEIDKNPAGRVVVELYDDVPIGSQRFADLAVGKDGVGYRLSKFDAITQVRILLLQGEGPQAGIATGAVD